MKLNSADLANKALWEEKGYILPKYDRDAVMAATKENPFWIHFGGGNIFSAFQANVVQNLLNDGSLDRGLVVAEGFDYEIIEVYHSIPYELLQKGTANLENESVFGQHFKDFNYQSFFEQITENL